jgi:hypothetical protein
MVGNTIMDVALDAMRQLGFEKKNLLEKRLRSFIDVYEGIQGCPLIEEAS